MPCANCINRQNARNSQNPCRFSDYAQVTDENRCLSDNDVLNANNTNCCYNSISQFTVCCDPNGVCCFYNKCDRNKFWPEFAHPTWLPCKDLYTK